MDLQFHSQDKAKNEEKVQTYRFRIDTELPACVLENMPQFVGSNDVTIYWRGNDSASGLDHFEMSIDNGPYTSVGDQRNMEISLSDGKHWVSVRVIDVAGNIGVGDSVTFTVDSDPLSFTGPLGPWLGQGPLQLGARVSGPREVR